MTFLASIAFGLDRPAVSFGLGADGIKRLYIGLADFVSSPLPRYATFAADVREQPTFVGTVLRSPALAARALATRLVGEVLTVRGIRVSVLTSALLRGKVLSNPEFTGRTVVSHIEAEVLSNPRLEGEVLSDPHFVGKVLLPPAFVGELFAKGKGLV